MSEKVIRHTTGIIQKRYETTGGILNWLWVRKEVVTMLFQDLLKLQEYNI